MPKRLTAVAVLGIAGACAAWAALSAAPQPEARVREESVQCANLIYAGSKSSVCFSDKFLQEVRRKTNIDADAGFTPVKLSSDDVFKFPFAIMTGEGAFSLTEQERKNLAGYLRHGGFLLASAGCSSQEWDQSFRREIKKLFSDKPLDKLPMDHPVFQTVYRIPRITLKNGGTTLLKGVERDGRLVLIYSSEGLNDTGDVKGCCCCGGNEVQNSKDVNTNVFAYALTY
jgi:hypothetical protein